MSSTVSKNSRSFGFRQLAAGSTLLLLVAVLAPVPAASAITRSKPPAPSSETPTEIANAAVSSGSSVVYDGRVLRTHEGCVHDVVAHSPTLAAISVTVQTESLRSIVKVGANRLVVPKKSASSKVYWVWTANGKISICRIGRGKLSARLLSHTESVSAKNPGGFVDLSSRVLMTAVAKGKSGEWSLPSNSFPTYASSLYIQFGSTKSGVFQVAAGRFTFPISLGPQLPAVTLLVPAKQVRWTRLSGKGNPSAIMLGFVTNVNDVQGVGSRLHVFSSPRTVSGSTLMLAGNLGLPQANSFAPATGVVAAIQGPAAVVGDPLDQMQASPLQTQPKSSTSTLLRIGNDGTIRLSSKLTFTIYGWLSGDIVRRPNAIDLTLPNTPQPTGAPTKQELTFGGNPGFTLGSVLIIGNGTYTPGGVIAEVTGLSVANGVTTVTYVKGGLMSAFLQMGIVSQVQLSSASTPAPVVIPSIRPRVNLGTFSLSKDLSLGKNPSISDSFNLSFSPSATLSITVNAATIFSKPVGISVHFAVDESTVLTTTVAAQGSWSGQKTVPLDKIIFGAIDVGPVWVTPELSANLTFAASASASISLTASIVESAHDGFTLSATSKGLSFFGDHNNGFGSPSLQSVTSPQVSLNASASVTASLQLSLDIYSVIGPDVQANADLNFDLNPLSSPWWTLSAGGSFQIGVNLNALDIPFMSTVLGLLNIPENPSWSLGQLGPWRLASASGPLAGPTGGAGSGSLGNPIGSPGVTGTGDGPGTVGGSSVGPVPAGSFSETTGGPTRSWSDYSDGGGIQGPTIASDQTLGIGCRITGLAVQDGNSWWYLVTSSPWNGDYYVSADAFFNNGATAGSLQGTPYFDPNVPLCHSNSGGTTSTGGASGVIETTGGNVNTWSNYSDAGGSSGPGISSNQSVAVTCRITGFAVSDGNTWWYQIASTPWNGSYYASADAFYNNGSTSGSLTNTPFYDPKVPTCGAPPATTTLVVPETTGGLTHTWTNAANAGGTEGPSIPSNQTVEISCRETGFAVADGDTWWYQIASSPWSNSYYASADAFYNNGTTSGTLVGTPLVDSGVPLCKTGTVPTPSNQVETTGGAANTWTNYLNAGGTQGPTVGAFHTIAISCRLNGFRVADGNTWWYQIASSPWNDTYYVSADAFFNNGATSGSLSGTPFVDPTIPLCNPGSAAGTSETAGGLAHTWTNYSNAGGTQGPSVSAAQTIQITCRVTGFTVADGNTWWYKISSSPWSNAYFVSADAFYNNGATSGSLVNTPFYDPVVPLC